MHPASRRRELGGRDPPPKAHTTEALEDFAANSWGTINPRVEDGDEPILYSLWRSFHQPDALRQPSLEHGNSDVTPASVFILFLLILAACTTAEQRQRAAENAEIKKQAADEIHRICALKSPEREAALEELKKESGYELHCAEK